MSDKFDAVPHMISIWRWDNEQKKKIETKYLPVAARIAWFRHDNPNGSIQTSFEIVGDYTLARAMIINEQGNMVANGSATVRPYSPDNKSPRDIEKAETAAIGRALAYAGFGTLEAGDELNDSEYLADAPKDVNPATGEIAPPANGNPRKMETRGEFITSYVDIAIDQKGQSYVIAESGRQRFYTWTRQPFRDAGIEVETWEKPGRYEFPPACIAWVENDNHMREIKTVELVPEMEEAS